jgi:predicted DNA-binding transcriptional regulator AlpA
MTTTRRTDRAELLTPAECADLFQVSERTLAYWRYEHRGPRWIKLGQKLVRYRREDVTAFIEKGQQHEQ